MPELILDFNELERLLPHRGLNLFVDEVQVDADRLHARSRTRIPNRDPRRRELLLRNDGSGRRCWSEPLLIELTALSGLCMIQESIAANGQISVFSMVSRLAFSYLPGVDEEVLVQASLERRRGDFSVFSSRAESGGRPVVELEVMSGAARLGDIAPAPTRPLSAPLRGEPIDPALFAWKPPHLRSIDRLVSADPATRTVVCSYTYPADHPFVAGHFPGAPVMMGVMQWSAVVDATWLAHQRFGINGPVLAQCKIRREGGEEILDVRDLQLSVVGGVPVVTHTKRVAFRDVVRPGDGMLIEVVLAAP